MAATSEEACANCQGLTLHKEFTGSTPEYQIWQCTACGTVGHRPTWSPTVVQP